MHINRRTIEVEWGHCDPAGIVFNPHYFVWFDAATAGLYASVGLPKHEMVKRFDIVGTPIVKTAATFHIPSKWGDIVTIESRVVEFRRSSFDIEHRLMKGDRLAVEGFETRVWVGRDDSAPGGIKARPIPQEMIDRFASKSA